MIGSSKKNHSGLARPESRLQGLAAHRGGPLSGWGAGRRMGVCGIRTLPEVATVHTERWQVTLRFVKSGSVTYRGWGYVLTIKTPASKGKALHQGCFQNSEDPVFNELSRCSSRLPSAGRRGILET